MAKKSKAKKNSNVSMIVSLICLVLSVLMVVSFFIPTYTYGDESANKVNGVTLTQVAFMGEEDYEQAVKDSVSVISKTEEERAEASKLATVYEFANDEENASFKVSIFMTWGLLIAGIAGIVFAVLALLSKSVNLGLLVSTGVGMLFAILLVILASSAVNHITESAGIFDGIVNIKTGVAVWFALVSSILATGSAVAGKVLKK